MGKTLRVPSMSILSRDPNVFRKPSTTQRKQNRFLKRTMVEKNGWNQPLDIRVSSSGVGTHFGWFSGEARGKTIILGGSLRHDIAIESETGAVSLTQNFMATLMGKREAGPSASPRGWRAQRRTPSRFRRPGTS